MARKQIPNPTPFADKPADPAPPVIGPDGFEDAVITWIPSSPAKRKTLKAWLDDVLPRAPRGTMSRKAYAQHLCEIARNEGMETTAGSIETRLKEKKL